MVAIGKANDIPKDPFVDKPFNFYSSYIKLAKYEKEDLIERDIVQYYKSQAV
jgi:hypothetical protein